MISLHINWYNNTPVNSLPKDTKSMVRECDYGRCGSLCTYYIIGQKEEDTDFDDINYERNIITRL